MLMLLTPVVSATRTANAAGLEGSQGVDTGLAPTASAKTVAAGQVLSTQSPIYADYQNMKVTVSQTQDLTNQTISVTWSGAPPTQSVVGSVIPFGIGGNFGGDFVQIMECWSAPGAAGPTPQQCEFGGNLPDVSDNPNPYPPNLTSGTPNEVASRELDTAFPANAVVPGAAVAPNGTPWMPFDPVAGPSVAESENALVETPFTNQPRWLNPYFDPSTTNEDDFGLTRPDGTGSEFFTVDTGLESSGLGCGQGAYVPSHGAAQIPKCWLVIVPRGTPQQEDDPHDIPSPFANPGVVTSALAPTPWSDRIVIPLGFTPVGNACPIGANEQQIVGSELALPAILSWEPVLCANRSQPPYDFAAQSDNQARQELTAGTVGVVGAPGMAILSRPVAATTILPGTTVTYAPLTLSGLVIGFNIQRAEPPTGGDPGEAGFLGTRVTQLNLTPLLVAKLLSQSYQDEFPYHINTAGTPNESSSQYKWLAGNPISIFSDPDFLQYNPEFVDLATDFALGGRPPVGLIVEQPTADATYELWTWILSDPQARAWLSGKPDPCTTWSSRCTGTKVNPLYLITDKNPSGAPFGTTAPDSFPANDPWCGVDPFTPGASANLDPPALCMLDWSPYGGTMQAVAQEVRTANDASKTQQGASFNPALPDLFWQGWGPQLPGRNVVMGVTDSASAAEYGLQVANLSAAGDDTSPTFVAPNATSFEAGEAEMSPGAAGLLQTSVDATGGYPLTTLTYAAALPSTLDSTSRQAYAHFITYAAASGQTPGVAPGQLPPGYAPLPAGLRAQARAAAHAILSAPAATGGSAPGSVAAAGTSPSPAVGPGNRSTSASGSGGSGSAGALTSGAGSSGSPASTGGAGSRGSGKGGGAVGRGGAGSGALPPARIQPVSSAQRTPSTSVGVLRYAVVVALGVGLVAGVMANWLGLAGQSRRRKATVSPD